MTWLSETYKHESFTPHHAQDFTLLPTCEILVWSSQLRKRTSGSMRSGWSDPSKSKRSLSACRGVNHSTGTTPFLCSIQACWLISIYLNSLEWTRSTWVKAKMALDLLQTCQLATSCLFISHAPWVLVGETELPQHQVQKPARKRQITRSGSSEANIWVTRQCHVSCELCPDDWGRGSRSHWRFSPVVLRINWQEFWRASDVLQGAIGTKGGT